MDKYIPDDIKEFLQREEVQDRIRKRMLRTRSDAKVSIGEVYNLLGFTENQLRKWQAKGLLSPHMEKGHRYYSVQDLDKLAIIRELRDEGFALGDIPPDIDRIWKAFVSTTYVPELNQDRPTERETNEGTKSLPIDQRIESSRHGLLWRYYASHALRYSLRLIRESILDTEGIFLGLILPFQMNHDAVKEIEDLPKLGESLVGWLAVSGSSHTLFTTTPSFENPSQYRVHPLQAMQEEIDEKQNQIARQTLIITNWRLSSLRLPENIISIILRLLAPLYANMQTIRAYFDQGMCDVLDPATDLNNIYPDYVLNGLADMAVNLGKRGKDNQWRFCCILVPSDTVLPIQLRNLIVRAQSTDAPHKIGKTLVSPSDTTISISLRAYLSGQVIYRPHIYEEDLTIALRDLENPRSAIAIPVDGEHDTPSAVLYLVSDTPEAFSIEDQTLLRLLGRMVREVLSVYRTRWQASEKLMDVLAYPQIINAYFAPIGILTEDEFIHDIEVLLGDIQRKMLERKEKSEDQDASDASLQTMLTLTNVLTLISISIDKQAILANRYGDQFAQNLIRVVGAFLQTQLRRILTDQVEYKLYSAGSGRFYLLLDQLPLEEARKHADRIRRRLDDTYEVDVCRPITEKIVIPIAESMQLVEVSVHIAIINYTYRKLEGLLKRYTVSTAVGNVRSLIDRDIDKGLNSGRIAGGNVVISWNPDPDREKRGFIRWSANLSD